MLALHVTVHTMRPACSNGWQSFDPHWSEVVHRSNAAPVQVRAAFPASTWCVVLSVHPIHATAATNTSTVPRIAGEHQQTARHSDQPQLSNLIGVSHRHSGDSSPWHGLRFPRPGAPTRDRRASGGRARSGPEPALARARPSGLRSTSSGRPAAPIDRRPTSGWRVRAPNARRPTPNCHCANPSVP